MSVEVNIFNDSGRKLLPKKKIKEIISLTLSENGVNNAQVSVILTDDKAIHELNKSYLNHNRPTDVITFSLDENSIEGEIYISIDTAQKQAEEFNVSLSNEILRLACHGALHLAGFDDKTKKDRNNMNKLESEFISKVLN